MSGRRGRAFAIDDHHIDRPPSPHLGVQATVEREEVGDVESVEQVEVFRPFVGREPAFRGSEASRLRTGLGSKNDHGATVRSHGLKRVESDGQVEAGSVGALDGRSEDREPLAHVADESRAERRVDDHAIGLGLIQLVEKLLAGCIRTGRRLADELLQALAPIRVQFVGDDLLSVGIGTDQEHSVSGSGLSDLLATLHVGQNASEVRQRRRRRVRLSGLTGRGAFTKFRLGLVALGQLVVGFLRIDVGRAVVADDGSRLLDYLSL